MPYPHLLGLLLTATAVFGRPTAAREPHSLQREAESNAAAASATIESVERDLSRMAEFGQEVRRNLNEQATASKDVQHALSYLRRQIELSASEREGDARRRQPQAGARAGERVRGRAGRRAGAAEHHQRRVTLWAAAVCGLPRRADSQRPLLYCKYTARSKRASAATP